MAEINQTPPPRPVEEKPGTLLKPSDLYERVQRAAKAVGIKDTMVRELSEPVSYIDGMLYALLREKRYLKGAIQLHPPTDIGYFVRYSEGITTASFHINISVFSPAWLETFIEALQEVELNPRRHNHHLNPTCFYTIDEIRTFKDPPLYDNGEAPTESILSPTVFYTEEEFQKLKRGRVPYR